MTRKSNCDTIDANDVSNNVAVVTQNRETENASALTPIINDNRESTNVAVDPPLKSAGDNDFVERIFMQLSNISLICN